MIPSTIEEVDWSTWDPVCRATLLFVFRDNEVLLIHKKTGFGKGKINGPGGRLEPGETPRQAAIREVEEEVGVVPVEITACGELYFQFLDGLSIHGFVFRAEGCVGEFHETREAKPFWQSLDQLPYSQMWEDDQYWFPHMVKGQPFDGKFVFDGENMLDYRLALSEQVNFE